jgi:hypothetical protein
MGRIAADPNGPRRLLPARGPAARAARLQAHESEDFAPVRAETFAGLPPPVGTTPSGPVAAAPLAVPVGSVFLLAVAGLSARGFAAGLPTEAVFGVAAAPFAVAAGSARLPEGRDAAFFFAAAVGGLRAAGLAVAFLAIAGLAERGFAAAGLAVPGVAAAAFAVVAGSRVDDFAAAEGLAATDGLAAGLPAAGLADVAGLAAGFAAAGVAAVLADAAGFAVAVDDLRAV